MPAGRTEPRGARRRQALNRAQNGEKRGATGSERGPGSTANSNCESLLRYTERKEDSNAQPLSSPYFLPSLGMERASERNNQQNASFDSDAPKASTAVPKASTAVPSPPAAQKGPALHRSSGSTPPAFQAAPPPGRCVSVRVCESAAAPAPRRAPPRPGAPAGPRRPRALAPTLLFTSMVPRPRLPAAPR